MTPAPPSEIGLNRALRTVHRSVLFTLGVCAALCFWTAEPAPPAAAPPNQRLLATLAAALGVTAIVTRRRRNARRGDLRREVALSLVSLLCATAVGLVGVAVAGSGGARTTALAYVLAGTLFALPPPRRIRAPTREPAP
jgi:peptidoglycan/LPS O-acetylase OafA/YrhL